MVNGFMLKFSLLISVYIKEKVEYLDQCLNSILNQTLSPDEIIIVEDGVLTSELYNCLDSWSKILPITRVPLSKNLGLGLALNEGLKYCSNELVARMDSDDVCVPARFELQINKVINDGVDVCGSWVAEFEEDVGSPCLLRKTPKTHQGIVDCSKWKNPVNHPTVVFKKSNVVNVGSYESVIFFEDYYLWLKLINSGNIFYNIQEPLVYMRSGNGQLSRRSGFSYARFELLFFWKCYSDRVLPLFCVIKNIIIRVPFRILPKFLLGSLYKLTRDRFIN